MKPGTSLRLGGLWALAVLLIGSLAVAQTSTTGPIRLWDGTNRTTVKAASTAAVAGDTALVVAVSPNNTLPVNETQIAGTAIVTGGVAGSQAMGGTDANNAAINQNPLLTGREALASPGAPAQATAGNQRREVSDVEGNGAVRLSLSPWSCFLTISSLTTTQCQAAPAASRRAYVVSWTLYTSVAGTGTTIDLVFGTGTNCATGLTALSIAIPNTATGQNLSAYFGPQGGLIPTAANAICVRQAGTTAGTSRVQLTGMVMP